MTKREQIMAAIKTLLAGTTGVDTRIYRSRAEAFARAETPALAIGWDVDNPSIDTSLPTLTWSLNATVDVIVRGVIPDQIADPIVESVHSKMTADASLGGLAMDVQPLPVKFELVDSDQPTGVIMCDYRIIYRTSFNDLSN